MLTHFSIFLINLEISHPDASEFLKLGAFRVSRSFIPGNLTDIDKTTEETFTIYAKSRGPSVSRVTCLLINLNAYQSKCDNAGG